MKKKILAMLFAAALVFSALLSLSACGKKDSDNSDSAEKESGECDHDWREGDTIVEATCDDEGVVVMRCNKCGETVEETVEALDHKFKTGVCKRCGVSSDGICKHKKIVDMPNKDATCASHGTIGGTMCKSCGKIYDEPEYITPLAHTPEVVSGYPATCTETGLSDGVVCQVCKSEIIEQTVIPTTPLVEMEGYDATCTEPGMTDYGVCPDYGCGKIFGQEEIPPLGHDYVSRRCIRCGEKEIIDCDHEVTVNVDEIPSTCSEHGYSTGVKCVNCDEFVIEPIQLPLLPHTEQTVPGYPSTCTETGRGDATVCSVCGATVVEAEILPTTELQWVSGYEATCTEPGQSDYQVCPDYGCGKIFGKEEIPPLGHNYVDEVCSRCGAASNASRGLKITLSESGSYYVVSGIGTCTDKNIILPSSYNSLPIKAIGENAFVGTNIESIVIHKNITTVSSGALAGCIKLTSIEVEAGNTSYKSINGNLYTYDGKTLVQYAIGKGDTSFEIPADVTTVGERAFANCTSLASVSFPSNLTSIGKRAFYGCENLSNVTIPAKVSSLGEESFARCESLASITVPRSVTSIGAGTFSLCKALKKIEVNSSNSYYTSVDGVLYSKDKKTLVQYPIGLTNFKYVILDTTRTISASAFRGEDNLDHIVIPGSVSSIGESAFEGCTKLCKVGYRGSESNWKNYVSIGDYNSNLTNAVILFNYAVEQLTCHVLNGVRVTGSVLDVTTPGILLFGGDDAVVCDGVTKTDAFFECEKCSTIVFVKVIATHCVSNEWVTTKDASCTTAGEQRLCCVGCGLETGETRVIPPLGHKVPDYGDGCYDSKCTRCKKTVSVHRLDGHQISGHYVEYGTEGVTLLSGQSVPVCGKTASGKFTCECCGKIVNVTVIKSHKFVGKNCTYCYLSKEEYN